MTHGTIRPSPQLMQATRQALAALALHWPNRFKAAAGSTESDTQFVEDYAKACVGADFDVIPEAARVWISRNKYAPSPSELGDVAREITPAREQYVGSAPPPPSSLDKNWAQIDRLYYRAKERLVEAGHKKFVVPIGQMWALLYGAQPTPELQHLVRMGQVYDEVWDQVVEAWLSGERPRPHPMNNLDLNQGAA